MSHLLTHLHNGLRNPMERKIDLSIKTTEKIPLRSTLHHRDRYVQPPFPLSQESRKAIPVKAQDHFLETAPKRSRARCCAVTDGGRSSFVGQSCRPQVRSL